MLPCVESLKRGRKYLVGYVGVMGKQEGIDYLLRAAKIINSEMGRTDVQFGLVGGGTELEPLKSYANELGLSEYVTFTGDVSEAVRRFAIIQTKFTVNAKCPTSMQMPATDREKSQGLVATMILMKSG